LPATKILDQKAALRSAVVSVFTSKNPEIALSCRFFYPGVPPGENRR
jgi:hypothetical protein